MSKFDDLEIQTISRKNVIILVCEGALVIETHEKIASAIETLSRGNGLDHNHVVFDLTGVDFADFNGIQGILHFNKDRAGRVSLVTQHKHIRDIFESTGVYSSFNFFSSQEEALKALVS